MNRKRAKSCLDSSDTDATHRLLRSSSSSDEFDTSGDKKLWAERRRKLRAKREELDLEQQEINAMKA